MGQEKHTLEKAKNIAAALLSELNSSTVDAVVDDGRDADSIEQYREQYRQFLHTRAMIENAEKNLAFIDIEGYDKCELDQAWRNAWDGCTTPHLPECKYNHAVKYAQWILSL